jgi:hypothetical protein
MLARGIVKVYTFGGMRGLGGNVGECSEYSVSKLSRQACTNAFKLGTLASVVTDTEGSNKCQDAPSIIAWWTASCGRALAWVCGGMPSMGPRTHVYRNNGSPRVFPYRSISAAAQISTPAHFPGIRFIINREGRTRKENRSTCGLGKAINNQKGTTETC